MSTVEDLLHSRWHRIHARVTVLTCLKTLFTTKKKRKTTKKKRKRQDRVDTTMIEQLQMQQQLDLEHMKVTQLKDVCRELGVKVGGGKQILIQRIIQEKTRIIEAQTLGVIAVRKRLPKVMWREILEFL
jgi:hypothetical protein